MVYIDRVICFQSQYTQFNIFSSTSRKIEIHDGRQIVQFLDFAAKIFFRNMKCKPSCKISKYQLSKQAEVFPKFFFIGFIQNFLLGFTASFFDRPSKFLEEVG